MIDQPLTRAEMISVIEGKGATRRAPVFIHFWVGQDFPGELQQVV